MALYQVAMNGVTDTATANVVQIVYFNHLIYHKNTAGNWYSKPYGSAPWTFTSAPPLPPVITRATVAAEVTALAAAMAASNAANVAALNKILADLAALTP